MLFRNRFGMPDKNFFTTFFSRPLIIPDIPTLSAA
jgi:hypothetical protein